MQDGIYAEFMTSKGRILIQLIYDKAPGTVGNFIGLAEGQLENKIKPMGTPYYDGLVFHRVISDFMIQGGCPIGTGTGGPGYQFDDEFNPDLRHNSPGILSMANSGPGTNGSQFFITHVETNWLDDKHTVFGQVTEGKDVVDAIKQGDKIEKINILRVGEEAAKWNAIEAFRSFEGSRDKRVQEEKTKKEAELNKFSEGFETTLSGLRYKVTKKGAGIKAKIGGMVSVHYEGSLPNGIVFDSSFKRNQPIDFELGIGQVIAGWDEGISLLHVGDQATFVIPSELGYGARGAGGVIPPNATLIFKVELVNVF